MRRKIITCDDVRKKLGYNSSVTNSGVIVGRTDDYIEFYRMKDGEPKFIDSANFSRIQKLYKADAIQIGRMSFYDVIDQKEVKDFDTLVLFYN